MILLTYVTHNSGYFDALKISSKNNGFDLNIIGWEAKWEGFIQRAKTILNFLQNIDKNELVCCVDGFDVLVLGNQEEVLNKFKSFNTDKVIFSASKDNFVLNIIYGKINKNDENADYNRLCAGCFIGYSHKIIELFENICKLDNLDNKEDDQYYLTKCYASCIDCIILDNKNILFYSLESNNGIFEYINLLRGKQPIMDEYNNYYKIVNKRIILKDNNNPPFIQGNGNINMDLLCDKLNLPKKITNNRNFYDYSTKKFVYKILMYFLGCIIYFIHFIFNITIIFLPYFTNNIYILLTIIIFNIYILSQWYLLDNCILNKIENDLLSRENTISKEGRVKSVFVYHFEKMFGEKATHVFFSLIPLLNSTYCYIKIIFISRKKIPFTSLIYSKKI
jgi:hypothetical protein